MASALDVLRREIKSEAEVKTKFKKIYRLIIKEGFNMSLEEILEIETFDSKYLLGLKYLTYFLKYLVEAPKGTAYTTLYLHYFQIIDELPDNCELIVAAEITKSYLGGLCKEVDTDKITELTEWIQVYQTLKGRNIEMSSFEDKLSIKISSILWKTIGDPDKNIEKCENAINLALIAQNNDIILGNRVDLLVSSVHSYFNVKYKIFSLSKKKNVPKASRLVEAMKGLLLENPLTIEQLEQLDMFFGSVERK